MNRRSLETILAIGLLSFLLFLISPNEAFAWSYGYVRLSTIDSSRTRTVTFIAYYPSSAPTEGSSWGVPEVLPLFVFAGAKDVLPDAYSAYRSELAASAVLVLLTTSSDSVIDDETLALDMVVAARFMKDQNTRAGSIFYKNISSETYCAGFSMGASSSFIAARELQNIGVNISGVFAIAPLVTAKTVSAAADVTSRTMIVCGTQDCKAPKSPNIDILYNRSGALCKTLCALNGGSHCRFIHNEASCRSWEQSCKDGTIPANGQEYITTQYISRFMFNNVSLPFSKPLQGYESVIKMTSSGTSIDNIHIIPSKTRACVGDTVVFSVDVPLATYLWMPGGITTPTYTTIAQRDLSVSLVVSNACYDISVEKTIDVGTATAIHFQPFEDLCAGGVTHLGVANSANYSSFVWSTGETTPTISVTNSGLYFVRAFDPTVCAEFIDTLNVQLQESERTQIKTQVLVPTCDIQHTVQISLGYTGQKDLNHYRLLWSTGDTTQSIILSKDGSYSLWCNAFQSLSNCAVNSDTIQFLVHTIYAPKPTITKLGSKLHAPKALFYQWRFNGSDIAGATNQEYQPTNNGRYSVLCSFDSLETCTKTSDLIDFTSDVSNESTPEIHTQFNDGQLYLTSTECLSRVAVVDVLGQIHIDKSVQLKEIVVDCRALAPGLYFIILEEGRKWLRLVIL